MYEGYVRILEEELGPAMGCTEPIAVAYAADLARDGMRETDRTIIELMIHPYM